VSCPTIAICALARDEEARMATFIRQHLPLADELLVVDTGSSDRTAEVAAAYGASVLRGPRVKAWDVASNAAVIGVRADWILWLCVDEFIATPDFARVKDLVRLADDRTGAYAVQRFTYFGNGHLFLSPATRLFRKLDAIRFEGSATESVTNSVRRTGLAVRQSGVALHHMGHVVRNSVRLKKATAYVDNLERQCAGRQMKPGESATYALLLRAAGRDTEALAVARQAAAAAPPDKPRMQFVLGQIERSQGLINDALEDFRRAAEISHAGNHWLLLAMTEAEAGHADLAARSIEQARQADPGLNCMADWLQGSIAWQKGDRQAARDLFALALLQNPALSLDWWPAAAAEHHTAAISDTPNLAREKKAPWSGVLTSKKLRQHNLALADFLQTAINLIPRSERGAIPAGE